MHQEKHTTGNYLLPGKDGYSVNPLIAQQVSNVSQRQANQGRGLDTEEGVRLCVFVYVCECLCV